MVSPLPLLVVIAVSEPVVTNYLKVTNCNDLRTSWYVQWSVDVVVDHGIDRALTGRQRENAESFRAATGDVLRRGADARKMHAAAIAAPAVYQISTANQKEVWGLDDHSGCRGNLRKGAKSRSLRCFSRFGSTAVLWSP